MMASNEERNAWKPIMHEHDNLKGTRGGKPGQYPDGRYQAKPLS